MTFETYKINWSWDWQTEEWLKHFCIGKNVLNFPCGKSKIGTVRADIDPTVEPDIVCSMENHKFELHSFDLVISDPPFHFKNIQSWALQLARLTKKELLISTPHIMLKIPGFKREIFATCRTDSMFVRMWILCTKIDTLSDFN